MNDMPKSSYNFKKAEGSDFPEFWLAFSQSIKTQFPEYSLKTREYFLQKEYSPQAIKQQLKNQDLVIYLAKQGQAVAGFLVARYITGGVGLGVWLAVLSEHQKKGLAKGLLKMWQTDAKKAGQHKLHLWTEKRNLKFYKKQGFAYVGKIPQNYYGADDYLFYKTLQKPQPAKFLK